MIVSEKKEQWTYLHFVDPKAKDYDTYEEPELWNRILRMICKENSIHKGMEYKTMEDIYLLKADELVDVNAAVDFLGDELRFKKFSGIFVSGKKFGLLYRRCYRLTSIMDKVYPSIGYIRIKNEVADKL